MRKLLLMIVCALIALPAFALDFYFEYTYEGQTLKYRTWSDTEVMVAERQSKELSGDLIIPATVEYNGAEYRVIYIFVYAFEGCSSLKSVTIPNSITVIGDYAFFGCIGLTSVDIPDSVTEIDDYAFFGCRDLTSVDIPDSVTKIGMSAFEGCSGLASVTIGNSVTEIGALALSDCLSLTSVDLPNSVVKLGNGVFYGCRGLTSVSLGNSVTSIGERAFYNCSSLTSVDIPNSVSSSIGNLAFYGCSSLTSVTIGNSVTAIGAEAFSGCSGLKSVSIGASVTTIYNHAFNGCSSLASVDIPSAVTSLGSSAFRGCSSLTSFIVEDGNNSFCSIDGVLFNKEQTVLIIYPEGNVGDYTIPNSVTSIGEYAFYNSGGLTSVIIGNSVTEIGESAFRDCTALTTVYYNNEEPIVGALSIFYSFDDEIYHNATLYVPEAAVDKCKQIDPWKNFAKIEAYDFSSNESDFQYTYEGQTLIYTITDEEAKTCEVKAADSNVSGKVVIPSTVNYNGTDYAIISIGNNAFMDCRGLNEIFIPNPVAEIGERAFSGCRSLMKVAIPNSVITIWDYAFSDCRSLKEVTIPISVTHIGNFAFSGSKTLEAVYYPATEPIGGEANIFFDTYSTPIYEIATLYVPAEAVEKCKLIDPWKNFAKIEAYDFSGVESVTANIDGEKGCEVYNLNGVCVGNSIDALAPGIYIVRQGSAVRKIAIK